MRLYQNINKGIEQVRFPSGTSTSLRLYIRSMCKADPAERLPRKKRGIDNIKSHKWYSLAGFDWTAMKTHKLPPPYVPKVRGRTDLANFQCSGSHMPDHIPYIDDGSG